MVKTVVKYDGALSKMRMFRRPDIIWKVFAAFFLLECSLMTSDLSALDNHLSDYQQQTEDFFEELRKIEEGSDTQKAIVEVAGNNGGLLLAFLDDMIATSAHFSYQEFNNPTLEPAENFVQRWSVIQDQCESCDSLRPIFNRILIEFSQSLKPGASGINPLSGIYNFYLDMSHKDLNGFETLFQFAWLKPQVRRTRVYEEKKISGAGKEDEVFVKQRKVIKTVDNRVVFAEFILKNKPAFITAVFQEISILHKALKEMEQSGADPDAIRLVRHLVTMVNQEIELSWNNGDLSDFSYQFLHNPDFQIKNTAISKHPLLKPPYSPNEFNVLQYY